MVSRTAIYKRGVIESKNGNMNTPVYLRFMKVGQELNTQKVRKPRFAEAPRFVEVDGKKYEKDGTEIVDNSEYHDKHIVSGIGSSYLPPSILIPLNDPISRENFIKVTMKGMKHV